MGDQTKLDEHGDGTRQVAEDANEASPEADVCIDNEGDIDPQAQTGETADSEKSDRELSSEETISLLTDEISHLKKQSDENFDRVQRVSAEFANYQKRKEQEIDRARKYSIDQFARSMLDVMESLDQACDIELAKKPSPSVTAMREGVELTRKQLLSAFESFGIEEVNPELGAAFDANFHQAMTMLPSSEVPANHICEVFRKGYRIHDRLLRPAMVIVASQPVEDAE
ncbi:MAG: nucleotide exchange factor GrpE [Acidiferrobacterales bacterium]|nr:nucleotide exchange factor GrpE [Acidiferrobacterales bacterium]